MSPPWTIYPCRRSSPEAGPQDAIGLPIRRSYFRNKPTCRCTGLPVVADYCHSRARGSTPSSESPLAAAQRHRLRSSSTPATCPNPARALRSWSRYRGHSPQQRLGGCSAKPNSSGRVGNEIPCASMLHRAQLRCPEEQHRPFIRGIKTGCNIDRRGLATAVRSNKPEDLAAPHIEGDGLQRGSCPNRRSRPMHRSATLLSPIAALAASRLSLPPGRTWNSALSSLLSRRLARHQTE